MAERPPAGAAEAALFSWLVGLPSEVDPALAARRLCGMAPFDTIAPDDGEAGRLVRLLDEVAAYPAERLSRFSRRRHGPRAR